MGNNFIGGGGSETATSINSDDGEGPLPAGWNVQVFNG